jgi:uncharacterized protein (TIGR02611 family)
MLWQSMRKIVIGVFGGTLLLLGVALLVLPGPGWLIIAVGIGVLATEFVWAQRVMDRTRGTASSVKDRVIAWWRARCHSRGS